MMGRYRPYRVTGVLLATNSMDCYRRGLDIQDVDHTAIQVDRVVTTTREDAVPLAAWVAAAEYVTWRWMEAPTVRAVESEVAG